jgi:GT2 family glycosyltransferase
VSGGLPFQEDGCPAARSATVDSLVSVVVVVKNDRRIDRLLTRLRELSGPEPRECVVVDASDRGRLDGIRERHSDVRWINFSPGSAITIAAQRNAGVREARGDVIVFTDADCVPDDGWLDALVAPIRQGVESVVAGRVRSLSSESVYDGQWDRRNTSVKYVEEAPTLNLAFTRDVFERYGRFDESMRYGSDVALTWRIVAGGTRIRFAPDAVVFHDWGDLRANIRRAFLYGEARARLYKSLPWARSRLLRRDFSFVAYALFLAGLPLTARFRPYPLLLVAPLVKNARSQPFQVVGLSLVAGMGFLRELVVPAADRCIR